MKVMQIFPKQEGFGSNCYCIVGESGSCGIVDPGMQGEEIANICKDNNLEVTHILLTHGHFDHIGGVYHLKKAYPKVCVIACAEEVDILGDPAKNLANGFFNTFDDDLYTIVADRLVQDGDTVAIDEAEIKVIGTPGHTKGSVCYLIEKNMFTGDTLFFQSYGRTDLYSGNHQVLMESLLKFDHIADNVQLFPGHNEVCTMADNRRFLQAIKKQRGL